MHIQGYADFIQLLSSPKDRKSYIMVQTSVQSLPYPIYANGDRIGHYLVAHVVQLE